MSNYQVPMAEIICCECGCLFAVPDLQNRAWIADSGKWFYCPNGHHQHYTSEKNRTEKLKAEVEETRRLLARQREAAEAERQARRSVEASLRATRGVVTKQKRRLASGTCPCCKRSFKNMAEHISKEHPDYLEEART